MEELETTTEVQVATGTDAPIIDGSSVPSFDNLYHMALFWSLIGIALLSRKMFRSMFYKLRNGSQKSKKD